MGCRCWANITIGGRLAAEHKAAFDALTINEFQPDEIQLEPGKPLYAEGEVKYGEFTMLERFCHEHGLHYCRKAEGEGSDGWSMIWWHPAMGADVEWAPMTNDGPVVDVAHLKRLLEGDNPLNQISALVKSLTPPEIPPLEFVESLELATT